MNSRIERRGKMPLQTITCIIFRVNLQLASFFTPQVWVYAKWCHLAFLSCGWCSAILLALGNPLLSYLMWRIHIIVDMADGTIARATKTFSKSADGFDRSNHIVINTSWLIFSAYPFVSMYELSSFFN